MLSPAFTKINEHLRNIFNDNELDKEVVVRKFRTTTQHGAIEGKTQTHEVLHYNLDVIIALGYRVQSPIAVRFRRLAELRDTLLPKLMSGELKVENVTF